MKSVGVKTLKNKLSEYLRFVREGEVVLVTDRDEVIAEISRPRPPHAPMSRWEAWLDREVRAGRMTPARPGPRSAIDQLHDDPLAPAPVDMLEVLEECRRDRS